MLFFAQLVLRKSDQVTFLAVSGREVDRLLS